MEIFDLILVYIVYINVLVYISYRAGGASHNAVLGRRDRIGLTAIPGLLGDALPSPCNLERRCLRRFFPLPVVLGRVIASKERIWSMSGLIGSKTVDDLSLTEERNPVTL